MVLRITVTLFGFGFTIIGVVHTAVSSTTVAMESTDPTNGCPNSKWTPKSRSCYLYVRETLSFFQANERCEKLESNLVSISSDEENHIIQEIVGEQRVWIGLYRTTNETCEGAGCPNWMWIDGSETGYRNWSKTFPSPGQCVFKIAEGDWGHHDVCSRPYGYVCEQNRTFPTTASDSSTTMSAREMTTFADPAGNFASSTDSSETNNDGSNMTLIIGCVIGGLVVSGITIVAVVILVKRHRKNKIALPKGSSQHHHPLSYRNSSHTDQSTRNMDPKSLGRDSPKKSVERKSSKRDQPKKDQEQKSHQRDKPKKVKGKSSTKDQQKNHNINDTPLKGATSINPSYCHEDLELGSTTSAHGGGFNLEPVYAEPIKKAHRPRSEGVKVQENSLYASGK